MIDSICIALISALKCRLCILYEQNEQGKGEGATETNADGLLNDPPGCYSFELSREPPPPAAVREV